jgi:hypothetical protein
VGGGICLLPISWGGDFSAVTEGRPQRLLTRYAPMTLPHALPHLGAVAGDYDILLCDVWGVIHNGRESWAARARR